jgi:HSP20 family protein
MADMKKNEQGQQQPNVKQQPVQGQQGQNLPVQQRGEGREGGRMTRGGGGDVWRSPFALMREMLRDPFSAMLPMNQELVTAFEVRETDDAFLFKADVPGIKAEDIDIQIHGNRLSISGSREQELDERSNDKFYTYERSYGSFTRVFTLPDNVNTEQIRTSLDNGVLNLVVPKKPGAQPRKIEVGSSTKH